MATAEETVSLAMEVLIPLWQSERDKLDRIDRWARWDHDNPHTPAKASSEFQELNKRSQEPWGDLLVRSIAQTLYVEGYRRPDVPEDSTAWNIWQANGQDGAQVALHVGALTYGIAYSTVLPGRDLTGSPMPVITNVSPRDMVAAYRDPALDEWPEASLRIRRLRKGVEVQVLDDDAQWTWVVEDLQAKPKEIDRRGHGIGVCPVVRFTDRFDLEGRASGEIEPFIPLLGKIDQTSFDRLVVQRFASWIVRTISGMSPEETAKATGTTADQVMMLLKVNDFLVAPDADTKFGSLPATPLDGFIKAKESDLQSLAAVSQTPAFEMLGQMANLSAEALEAAKDSQTAKSVQLRHTLGEAHERRLRLASYVAGDVDGAADFRSQVRWADTSIRSLSQAADAFGKMATQLGIPPQVLWAKIPGMTQLDIDEATALLESGDATMNLLLKIQEGLTSPQDPAVA